MTTAHELLRSGGAWLRAARSYLQSNVRGGDRCTWSSYDVLELTVRQIEELAAHAVAADCGHEVELHKVREKLFRCSRELEHLKTKIDDYHELKDTDDMLRGEIHQRWCKTCKHMEKEYREPPCDECFRYFAEVKNHEPVQE